MNEPACFFCDQGTADSKQQVEIKLHKKQDLSFGGYWFYLSRTICVPRCRACADFHETIRGRFLKTRGRKPRSAVKKHSDVPEYLRSFWSQGDAKDDYVPPDWKKYASDALYGSGEADLCLLADTFALPERIEHFEEQIRRDHGASSTEALLEQHLRLKCRKKSCQRYLSAADVKVYGEICQGSTTSKGLFRPRAFELDGSYCPECRSPTNKLEWAWSRERLGKPSGDWSWFEKGGKVYLQSQRFDTFWHTVVDESMIALGLEKEQALRVFDKRIKVKCCWCHTEFTGDLVSRALVYAGADGVIELVVSPALALASAIEKNACPGCIKSDAASPLARSTKGFPRIPGSGAIFQACWNKRGALD